MKKLIIAALIPLLVGCTEKYVLHANLRSVTDRKEIREDDMGNDINIRCLHVYYAHKGSVPLCCFNVARELINSNPKMKKIFEDKIKDYENRYK